MKILQIPTTRAISPKLGRKKTSASPAASSESAEWCLSPKVVKEQGKSPRALKANSKKSSPASKGTTKSPPVSTEPQQSSETKTEENVMAVETKAKPEETMSSDEKTSAETNNQTEEGHWGEKSEMNSGEDEEVQCTSTPNTVVMAAQVWVEG